MQFSKDLTAQTSAAFTMDVTWTLEGAQNPPPPTQFEFVDGQPLNLELCLGTPVYDANGNFSGIAELLDNDPSNDSVIPDQAPSLPGLQYSCYYHQDTSLVANDARAALPAALHRRRLPDVPLDHPVRSRCRTPRPDRISSARSARRGIDRLSGARPDLGLEHQEQRLVVRQAARSSGDDAAVELDLCLVDPVQRGERAGAYQRDTRDELVGFDPGRLLGPLEQLERAASDRRVARARRRGTTRLRARSRVARGR